MAGDAAIAAIATCPTYLKATCHQSFDIKTGSLYYKGVPIFISTSARLAHDFLAYRPPARHSTADTFYKLFYIHFTLEYITNIGISAMTNIYIAVSAYRKKKSYWHAFSLYCALLLVFPIDAP